MWLRPLLLCSIALAALPAVVATWRGDSWYGRALCMGLLAGLCLWHLAPALCRRDWSIQLGVVLVLLNLTLVLPELLLRAVHFRYASGIQVGYPQARDFHVLLPDPVLLWRLRPHEENFLTPWRGPGEGVNSLGFPGPEIALPKPQNTYRIMYLGDSCTQEGYPFIVESMLNDVIAGARAGRVDSAVLAVAGYSSHQGRLAAQMYGEKLDPDLAVVLFGWNDHWLGPSEDEGRGARVVPPSSFAARLGGLLGESRVVQGIRWLRSSGADPKPNMAVRVPPDAYRRNLLAIKGEFDLRKVPVIFVTAPTSMYRAGVPEYLMARRFARSADEVLSAHRAYNEIVRAVAAETHALLLDLEREFNGMADLEPLFGEDRIHWSEEGNAVTAALVARFVERSVLSVRDR